MQTHNLIVIYQEIPENAYLYRLVLSSEDYVRVLKCHGKFFNSDDATEDMEWFSELLAKYNKIVLDVPYLFASENETIITFGIFL